MSGRGALLAGSFVLISASWTAQAQTASSSAGTDGVSQLGKIQVEATEDTATTEDSGSYTSSKITIGKAAQSLREIPQSVSVLTRQRLDDQNLTTLGEALDQTVGVDSADPNGLGFFDLYSRGGQVVQQYDGVPATSIFHFSQEFDLAIYDRVEVLRGPAGLLQGAGNSTGVANLVRKRPRSGGAIRLGLIAGSWENYHADLDVTGALNQSGTIRGRVVAAGADRNFYYDVASEQRRTGYGIVELDITDSTTVGLSYAAQSGAQTPFNGLPASTTGEWLPLPRSTFVGMDWLNVDRSINESVVDLRHRFADGWTLQASARQRDWDRHQTTILTRAAVDPALNRTNFQIDHLAYDYESVGADLNVSGPVALFGRTHELLFGYNFDQYEERGGRARATFNNRNLFNHGLTEANVLPITSTSATQIEQTGFYGMARIRILDSLTAIGGGRVSDYTTKTRALTPAPGPWTNTLADASNEFTPYGGLVWDITTHLSLYASYADSFSPQSTTDFFGDVLEPIVGWQAETGVKGEFFEGQLNASFAVFRIRNENSPLLDPDPAHLGCGGTPDGSCSIAGGLTESKGWELEIGGSPLPGWELSAGYTDNETQIIRDNDPANVGQPINSYRPARLLKLWSNYRFANRFSESPLRGLNVGFGLQGASRTSTSNLYVVTYGFTPVEQDSYVVANAQAGYRFSDKLQASLTINNITDRKYFTQLNDARSFNYYGEPRNVALSVRMSF